MVNLNSSSKDSLIETNTNTIMDIEQKLLDTLSIDPPDPLAKYKKLYVIFILFGAITMFVATFTPFGAIFGAFIGFGLAWFVIQGIALIRLLRLNFTNHMLPVYANQDEIFKYLSEHFSHPDLQIDNGLLSMKFIFKNKTEHIIFLNEEKKTFSMSSRMTKKARFKRGGKENSAIVYRNAMQVLPVIQRLLENATISINKKK
ncbi:hypothetical protein [Aneurinibacillus aneurinilyticus]|jgi:hypothetical protein|uniref:hypothetical protein n=1 Tax=Aneurinibacillus aneurinilyticus TaxID=1391 RepID=UPI0023F92A25|nr:hypothetical protein [Aneurinibacillus aneurinilyticus]MCI1693398.1 hypothetical protein [Aneurinibacillus aneurinilyticus]